jgi:hypothetical protein
MKRFVVRLFVVLLAALVALGVVDMCVTQKLRHSRKLPYAGWNDIVDGKAGADVLIMGSSRAWSQYSSEVLDSILDAETYNLGIDGSHFNRQMVKYAIYRQFNKKPKLIIQNIDFCSTLQWTHGYMTYQYYPFFMRKAFRKMVFPMEEFTFAEKWFPMYRYSSYGVKRLFEEEVDAYGPMKKGYFGVHQEWDDSRFREQNAIRFSFDARTLELFSEYLSTAKQENVKVVMVYAPVYSEVTERMENLNEMYATFDSLSRKYDVPILDFNYSPICVDTTCFYNATHLNEKGAVLFSKQLAQKIDSLLLCL